jgi:site-specific DNA-methyltransferase (adenine-specific)
MPRTDNSSTTATDMTKPYFEKDGTQIIHGDAQAVLPLLKVQFDGIYTDPPWGIDKVDWDKNVWPVLSVVSRECVRLLKVDGYLFWFYAEENLEENLNLFKSYNNLKRGTTYQYQSSNNMAHGTNMHTKTTKALVYSFTNKFLHMKDLKDYPIPGRKLTDEDHPTVKPLDAMKDIIEHASQPGQLILDPFAGSGQTLIAAVQLGRKAIGIESEESYCEKIARRLERGE